MGRLRVKCPLESCPWAGDHSELGSHLTSSETHLNDAKGAFASASAEAFNDRANQLFKQGSYRDAMKLYSKAISITPATRYIGNRAAAWLAVGAYEECINDCQRAVKTDQ
eukprot:8177657-Pyramimonas_sp.AAC.1